MSDERTFEPEHFNRYLLHDDEYLAKLEKESIERDVPIIGPSVAKILYTLVKATGAKKILELGTANGYSTIWLAKAMGEGGCITTMEWSQEMADEAAENFKRSKVDGLIEIMVGDALSNMEGSETGFDMIFMDIEKEMYSAALPHVVRLLRSGGMLVCDNVAFVSSGTFNDELDAHPQMETAFIFGHFHNHSPDDDALSISVKK